MDQRIKDLWVKALESGEYPQGKNALRNDKGFCCLGVLCDIYAKETDNVQWVRSEFSHLGNIYLLRKEGHQIGFGGVLPRQVLEWAQLRSSDPEVTGKKSTPFLKSLQ